MYKPNSFDNVKLLPDILKPLNVGLTSYDQGLLCISGF